MDLHWIQNPLTVWGTIGVGLAACLNLFVSLKREIHAHATAAKQADTALCGSLVDIATDLQALREGVRSAEAVAPAAPASGQALNLTKRAQVLRMHRRGEALPTIAAAVKVPQNEVRLLLKIHEALKAPEA